LHALPQALQVAFRGRRVIPFIGAGISRSANHNRFPTWIQFLRILANEGRALGYVNNEDLAIIRNYFKKLDFEAGALAIRACLPRDVFDSLIEKAFSTSNVTLDLRQHSLILKLRARIIVTTNYDRLLEKSIAVNLKESARIFTHSQSDLMRNEFRKLESHETPLIFKAHGDLLDARSIVLTSKDYSDLIFLNDSFNKVIANLIENYTLVFMGYSLSDRDILRHLEQYRSQLSASSTPHYAIADLNQLDVGDRRKWREQYGIEVIHFDRDVAGTGLRRVLSSFVRCVNNG
jgi:hypothetical protein